MKKALSIITSVIIVISTLFSVNISFAKETSEENILVNPVYENYLSDEDAQEMISEKQSKSASEEDGIIRNNSVKEIEFKDIDSAAAYLRDSMIARQELISFSVKAKKSTKEAVMDTLLETATSERLYTTSSSGDYLRWSWGGCGYNCSESLVSGGYAVYTYDIYFLYYTNARQEKEVDAEIADAIDKLNLATMTSTYDKISAIYNYICKVADYDMVVQSPDDNPLSFTAYGCLIENKTVCQGYATAIYKICKTLGIPVRVINNDVHGWNIVKIGNKYYNIDATWDDNNSKPYDYSKAKDGVMWGDYIFHSYFLKSDADLQSDNIYHYKDSSFLTDEFEKEYPISSRSYYVYTYEDAPITSGNFYHTAYCPVCGEVEIKSEKCTFNNKVCIYCSRDITDKTQVTGLYTAGRGDDGARIRLAWNAVEDATEYNIYQKISGKYEKIGTSTTTGYNVTELHSGWEYYFKVAAVINGEEGTESDELHTVAACASPTGFTVEAVSDNQISVEWDAGSAHGYYLEWSTDPTFKTNKQSANLVGVNNTSKTITVNGNAKDYYVRVRLWRYWEDGYVYGNFSDAVKVAKVTGLYTAGRGDDGARIRLAWNAVDGATEYNIYQKKDGEFVKIGSSDTASYNATELHSGWEYYFKVSAIVDGKEVGMSDEFHTVAACASPTGFTVEAVSENQISVKWDAGSAHGYYLEWSTDPTFKTNKQSANLVGVNNTSKTITVNGNAGDYYVRVRLWRYWQDGYVYGSFSQAERVYKVTGLYTAGRGGEGSTIRLAWNAVDGATEYKIYKKVSGKYEPIGTTKTTDFNAENLHSGWEYYFKVSAMVDGEEVGMSDEFHTVAACASPTGLTAKVVSDNEISVTWDVGSAHGYYLEWSTDPTFATNKQSANLVGVNNTSRTIKVNGNADEYYIRVRLWRYWEDGYVYGSFSQALKVENA